MVRIHSLRFICTKTACISSRAPYRRAPPPALFQQSLGFIDKEEESSYETIYDNAYPPPPARGDNASMFCPTKERGVEATHLVRRMMAVVIVMAILPLIAAEAAGQALFRETLRKSRAQGAGRSNARNLPLSTHRERRMADPIRLDAGRALPEETTSRSTTTSISAHRPRKASFLTRPTGKFPTSRGRWQGEPSIGPGWRAGGRARAVNACMQTRRRFVSTPSRATYRGGFEILQGPGYVLMMFNFGHYSRYIPTDGRPHRLGDRVKLWMGNSRGTWRAIRSLST